MTIWATVPRGVKSVSLVRTISYSFCRLFRIECGIEVRAGSRKRMHMIQFRDSHTKEAADE